MTYMSRIITVSVNEEVESEFRRQAAKEYGKRKGYLGKAFTSAMKEWTRKNDAEDADAIMLRLLKTGIKTTKKWKFNREELYGDRVPK